jgi:hypothetical protein
MRATEYIAVLRRLVEQYGDLPCTDATDGLVEAPLYFAGNKDWPSACFVLCDRATAPVEED